MRVRSLPKTNKGVQEKILAHGPAVRFLEHAGFSFDHPDVASLREYNKKLFSEAQDEINDHIVYLGGNVSYQKMDTA